VYIHHHTINDSRAFFLRIPTRSGICVGGGNISERMQRELSQEGMRRLAAPAEGGVRGFGESTSLSLAPGGGRGGGGRRESLTSRFGLTPPLGPLLAATGGRRDGGSGGGRNSKHAWTRNDMPVMHCNTLQHAATRCNTNARIRNNCHGTLISHI